VIVGGSTTLVVPCFNEAARFPRAAFVEFLRTSSGCDFVFVDDGSADDTASVLANLAAEHPDRCRVLPLDENRGKGEAVRLGMLSAMEGGTSIVGFWDSDLATPLDLVEAFLRVFETRPEVQWVVGSRVRLLGRRIDRRAWRHYLGRVFATAVSLWLGVAVYDTQCGAKLFRAGPELERLLAEPFLSRWIFDVELFARFAGARGRRAAELERLVVELPLGEWRDVEGSKVRAGSFLRSFLDFLRIARTYR
jgi:glycosyltransferase involved in cell wall biosynthesis